jgi:protein-tyrosine-phosphatase
MMPQSDSAPGSILFVCTMNAVRSPMAAALLHNMAGEGTKVDSAGVEAGQLDPLAVEVMKEIGIALSTHRPRCLSDLRPGAYDLVVTLSREAQLRMQAADPGAPIEYWPVGDPTGTEGSREQRLLAYRAVRDELLKKLNSRFHMAPA